VSGTYFVTGAAGFVGRHLCRLLRAQGKSVIGLVRDGEDSELAGMGVRLVKGRVEEPQSYVGLLDECTYVVHAAGDPRFGNGPGYRAANVDATRTLLEAVRSSRALQRFVYVSSIGAVDRESGSTCDQPLTEASTTNPASDYGRSKLEAEALVASAGMPYAIVRPCMVVGADMRANSHMAVFARAAATHSLLARIAWPGQLSVIHVDDLAHALVAVAEDNRAAGRVFIAAGDPVRLKDLFDTVNPAMSRLPVAWAANAVRPLAGWLPFSLKVLLYPALTADDTALRALGWQPTYDAATSLRDVVQREKRRVDKSLPLDGITVVTGAASGLGRAVAEQLAERGRRLLLIDRDEAGLAATAKGVEALRVVCDLGDDTQRATLLRSPEWNSSPIDELFACAGFGLRGAVSALPVSAQAEMIQVNVVARLVLAHDAARRMKRRQFGRIVLISSSSAYQALPFMSVYAASNAAVLLFGEGLASELRGDGIEVLTVCPGGMDTSFQSRAGVRKLEHESLMSPAAVASEILAVLGRDRVTLMPSTRSKAMALAARVLPRRLSLRLWHRMMEGLR
jgi:nucleoside-diphosphate-sugar epimerase